MGCDIHFVVERMIEGEWVGMLFETPCRGKARERDYDAFAELAGVRGEGSKGRTPRGIPDNASKLARHQIAHWGEDGHSHSHLSLEEFCQAYRDADDQNSDYKTFDSEYQREYATETLFGLYCDPEYGDPISGFRVIFWFDN